MAVVASMVGVETKCFKRKSYRTSDGKIVHLVDHKSRFVRLNTDVEIGVKDASGNGVVPQDEPNIQASVCVDFSAEYNRVTGALVTRKIVKAGTSGWTLTGQELIIEKGDPAEN